MNSRQRLMNTLRRQPVDRVPISTYEMVGLNPDAWENQQPAYHNMMEADPCQDRLPVYDQLPGCQPRRPYTVKGVG